uniref:Mitochondrial proton/calcium exchanger protein n=1 Tax=Timema californicum TaxID=61474 RepID=A0A7R9P5P7_TIMCA|nr:unnamed protein product [Timema californicum]
MHAFLNKHKSVAVKTNSFVKSTCRCRHLNTCHVYKCDRLGFPTFQVSCPMASTRFLSTLARTSTCVKVHSSIRLNFTNPSFQANCDIGFVPIVLNNSSFNTGTGIIFIKHFHVGSTRYDTEPFKSSSKVEDSVKALKEDLKECDKPPPVEVKVKKSLKQKIVDEVVHYYHGFRLLFIDINISRKLLWRVLNGKTLTRREHNQLVRTVGDLFRLVPFSVFVIVPFMELLLPLAIKFFPGMLPSTFQTVTEKEDKMKQALKVKLEMAKFLQKTLDEMAVEGKGHRSEAAKEFADFVTKLRSSGQKATNKEILKFSKLFKDELTLDSLTRPQLVALCRVLELQPIGTINFLRFQLRMKLRSLAADDKMIQKEGVDSLTPWELQQACRARGMRAYGMSEAGLRNQLEQWLDLSLNEKVPPSLLLLSRALLLPDTVSTADQLKATISVLPDTVVNRARAVIGEREGKIDNKTKIDLICEEEKRINEERLEETEEEQKRLEREVKELKEILKDKAPILRDEAPEILNILSSECPSIEGVRKKDLSSIDLEALEDALDTLGKDKKKLIIEKEELDTLKEEMEDYKEDVQDLNQVMLNADKSTEMKESKAARRLFKKVSGMIHKMDAVLSELEQEEEQLKRDLKEEIGTKEQDVEKKSEELVTIEELIASIKQIQKIPDESLVNRIAEVLEQMDVDKDGAIRVDHVLKVLEVVGKENVKLNKKQMDELLDLLKKEEVIELEDQIAKALEKESMDHDLQSSLKENSVFNEKKDSVVTKTPTNSSEAMKVSPLPLSAPASSPTMSAISPANCNKTIDEPKEKKDNSKTL